MSGMPWRSLAAACVALSAVSLLPVAYGRWTEPPGQRFMGFFDKVPDSVSYLTKMRTGYSRRWAFTNRYTTTPQQPTYTNLFFTVTGRVARTLGLSLTTAFHLYRLLFGISMILIGTWFTHRLWEDGEVTRAAVWLLSFGNGLGWLVGPGDGAVQRSLDLWAPESNAFYSFMVNPLFCFATALLAACLLGCHACLEQPRWTSVSLLSLGALVLALAHPYDVITLCAACALLAAVQRARRRTTWGAGLTALAAVTLPSALVAAHYWYAFHSSPSMTEWLSRNVTPTPRPQWVLAGMGLFAPGALAGICMAWKKRRGPVLVAACWAVATLGCIMAPVQFQRKLLLGVHVPLACLTAVVWCALRDAGSRRGRLWLPLCLLLGVLTFGGSAFYLLRSLAAVSAHPRAFHLTTDELEAFDWIQQHGSADDAVLCSPHRGLFLPALTDCRVFVGHWGESGDFERKQEQWQQFWSPTTSDAHREEFLQRNDIRLVLPGDIEGDVVAADGLAALDLVFRSGQVSVYAVRRESGS